MYKNTLLVACLSVFTIACSQKTEKKELETTKTENKTDTLADDDENAGYEMNAEVTSTKDYNQLVPDGFVIMDKAEGDSNNDGTQDMLLVLKSQQEKDEELLGDDAPERMLRLLVKDANGMYSIAADNNNAIFKKNMGGAGSDDPYQSITVKPGQFSITHMGGSTDRWTYRHTFSYNKAANAWFLKTIEEGDFDAMDPKDAAQTIKTAKQFGEINFVNFKGV